VKPIEAERGQDRSRTQREHSESQLERNEECSGNTIVEGKTQLVRNTVNTDSSKVDRLYPESINKITESANSELR